MYFMKKWFYNKNGQAVALDCGDSLYDQNGNFALWVHGRNLYNQDGDHVGWTEGGVFYDSNNDVIGFTRDHTQHLPSNPGYGGWSDEFLEDYIEE